MYERKGQPNGNVCYCGTPVVSKMKNAIYCSETCKRKRDSKQQKAKAKAKVSVKQ